MGDSFIKLGLVMYLGQSVSLCGVNAYHQNGKAQRRIRESQDLSRTSSLHSTNLWSDAIDTVLWPYAIRNISYDINMIPSMDLKSLPLQRFSGSTSEFKMAERHPYGCPMYILNSKFQASQKLPKWAAQTRLAI
jgi:hypothetical protein